MVEIQLPSILRLQKREIEKKEKRKKKGKTAAMNEGCGFVKLSTLHTVDSR